MNADLKSSIAVTALSGLLIVSRGADQDNIGYQPGIPSDLVSSVQSAMENTIDSVAQAERPAGDSSSATESTPQDSPDAQSVQGRAFPVSRSVKASCRVGCEDLNEVLSQFAQQPRDPVWARSAETKLRNLVLKENGKYTIRAIECRTSLCVIEVASIYGSFEIKWPD